MNLSTRVKSTRDEVLGLMSKPTPCARSNSGCTRYNVAEKTRARLYPHGSHLHIGKCTFRVCTFNCPGPERGSCNGVASFARKAGIHILLSSMGAATVDRGTENETQETHGTNDSASTSGEQDGWRHLVTGDESRFPSRWPPPKVGSGQR
jgi:hypothetical protein